MIKSFKPVTGVSAEAQAWDRALARAREFAAPIVERPRRNRTLTVNTTPRRAEPGYLVQHRRPKFF